MRTVILALSLMYLSIKPTGGANLEFVPTQRMEFPDPIVITASPRPELCRKYHRLFMEALHKSLECSEDYGPPPHGEEGCAELSRLVADYSKLRSAYCYGEYL